jgi:ribosomal protein L37AE/L43A
VKGTSLASRPESLVCPLCEAGQLKTSGIGLMRRESCGGRLSGTMLETLRGICALPDALGKHACEECGHPQVRRLPDGTYHCPSCGSEVLRLEASGEPTPEEYRTEAYRSGWIDGRFAEVGCFTENPNLARWHDASDRLEYYRGHRAGSEARNAAMGGWEEQVRERLLGSEELAA